MLRTGNVKKIFLPPGDYFVGNSDYEIRTLLGSCVAITLWHPVRRIGAMSHFLLARRQAGRDGFQKPDGHYGEEAMWLILQELERLQVAPAECQGKIFGGANMFPGQTQDDAFNIGRNNGEAARALLREHCIPIFSESLFGVGHRMIIFDVGNGDVWVRQGKMIEAGLAEAQECL